MLILNPAPSSGGGATRWTTSHAYAYTGTTVQMLPHDTQTDYPISDIADTNKPSAHYIAPGAGRVVSVRVRVANPADSIEVTTYLASSGTPVDTTTAPIGGNGVAVCQMGTSYQDGDDVVIGVRAMKDGAGPVSPGYVLAAVLWELDT